MECSLHPGSILRSTCTAALLFALVSLAARAQEVVAPVRVVDGVINAAADAGEYVGSSTSFVGIGGDFRVQTYRDGGAESIQILVRVNDLDDSNANDFVRLYFDMDHDGVATDADREVQISRDEVVLLGGVASGPPTGAAPLNVAQWDVDPNTSSGWAAEVELLPSDLGTGSLPAIMGMLVFGADNNSTFFLYPTGATVGNQEAWADLKTRYPLDYMIVLDRSGSMLSNERWEQAKTAADIFANTMAALVEPSHFADRIGVVGFNWPCFGTSDGTATDKALAPVGVLPGDYIDTPPEVESPESDFCTPIGEGLNTAFLASNLNASDPDTTQQHERAVLLLTDGLHNRPSEDVPLLPSHLTYPLCNPTNAWGACPAGTESNVAVNTVGFGVTGSVSEELLSDIQIRFGGAFSTSYSLSPTPQELVASFLGGLGEFYDADEVYDGVPTGSFTLLEGNEKLIVIQTWPDRMGGATFSLEVDTGSGPTAVSCDGSEAGSGFAICTVDDPAGGDWEVASPAGSHLYALVDLRLNARFAVEPVQPETGESLLLTVELTDRGVPVLHDATNHPVRVTADVTRPGESVGTFVTTRERRTCERTEPQLPTVQDPQIRVKAGQPGAAGVTGFPAVATGSGDPKPPLFALVEQLLEACDQEGLPIEEEPDFELRDDGTQGDATAGDGIYSYRYTDTDIEGTYTFRFDVDGTTADGEPFMRTKRLGAYTRIDVDPASSVIDSRVLAQEGTLVIREYYLLPRDQFGGYLGPGRAHKVGFELVSGPGSFTGDVIDYGNGYYARRLEYDRTQGEPTVVPTVYGDPLQPSGPGPGLAGRLELGLFAGLTVFDDGLRLDDGPVVGARVGVRVAPPLVLEAEGAVTFADSRRESGQVIQLLGGGRYDVRLQRVVLFASAGGGVALFRGYGGDEEAEAYYGGVGAIVPVGRRIGLRGDIRLLGIGAVAGADASTNLQLTGGVIIRF